MLGAVLLLGEESLWVAPRVRLALALVITLVIAYASLNTHRLARLQLSRHGHLLVDSAYAMFLTHFGVIVIFSAAWEYGQLSSPTTALCLSGLAWVTSMAVGVVFHVKAEKPFTRWVNQPGRWNLAPWLTHTLRPTQAPSAAWVPGGAKR